MNALHRVAGAMVAIALTLSACGGGSGDDEPADRPTATASSGGVKPTAACIEAVRSGSALITEVSDTAALLQPAPGLMIDGGEAGARSDLPDMEKAQDGAKDIRGSLGDRAEPLQKALTAYETATKTCEKGKVAPACRDSLDQTEQLRTAFGTVYTELLKYLPLVTDLAVAAAKRDDATVDAIEAQSKQISAKATEASADATRIQRQLSTSRTGCGGT